MLANDRALITPCFWTFDYRFPTAGCLCALRSPVPSCMQDYCWRRLAGQHEHAFILPCQSAKVRPARPTVTAQGSAGRWVSLRSLHTGLCTTRNWPSEYGCFQARPTETGRPALRSSTAPASGRAHLCHNALTALDVGHCAREKVGLLRAGR